MKSTYSFSCCVAYLILSTFLLVPAVQGLYYNNGTDYPVDDVTEETSTETTVTEDDYEMSDPFEELYNNDTMSDVISSRLLASGVTTPADGTILPYAVLVQATLPAYVSLGRLCTGAFISLQYVITIASCVAGASAIQITYSGALTQASTGVLTATGTALFHPKYYTAPSVYDIALIQLSAPITASTTATFVNIAQKYNIDESKDLVAKPVRVVAYGHSVANTPLATWGLTYHNSMTVMTKSACIQDFIANGVTTTTTVKPNAFQECLSTQGGTIGACNNADIGGLVLYQFTGDTTYTLAGLIDYFQSCSSTVPNMFVRIGPFWDWIRKYVSTRTNVG